MTTLKDIAKAAGVSMTTVSNVINGNHGRVSADTVEKIRSIIKESGYVPNQAARSLAQRESRIVAVIIQAIGKENLFRNPYTAEYVGALTVELYEKGYYPLIRYTDDYRDVEADLRGWNVAGAIFSGTFPRHLKNIKSLTMVPTVFTDCYFRIPGANHVGVDDVSGGQLAAEYLAEKGHKRMAFVANSIDESDVDQHRLEGFRRGLEPYGIELTDEFVLPTPATVYDRDMLNALVSRADRPTAIFCTADRVAAQLMQSLNSLGFSVPGDFSVMGFDDLPMAEITNPPLTTLRQDIGQKAQLVVDMLVRHIRNKSLPEERTLMGVKLVERSSVRQL